MCHPSLAILAILAAAGTAGVPSETPITARRITGGLNESVALAAPPGDLQRLFVVSKLGFIRIVDLSTGIALPTPFLNIDPIVTPGGERGLLDLRFDPDYASNGHFYISYSLEGSGATILARYTVSADPDVADPDSEVVLKSIAQFTSGHNAGQIQFGPDGYLYLSTGDGSTGFAGDPMNNAQNPQLLLGKILRLDTDDPPDYIPPDNPFVGDPSTLDEIWALGLRNPWRFSFDRLTGVMYVADVGKDAREEVDAEPAGGPGGRNYGWRCMEGTLCTGLAGCTCNDPSLTLPIFEYPHGAPDFGCAIIGGYVYRGKAIPDLAGQYLYADFCADYIRSFRYEGGIVTGERDHTDQLNPLGEISEIGCFWEDTQGELYIASVAGTIWKIVPDGDCNGNATPDAQEVLGGMSPDCNGNDLPDDCDVASGLLGDCNGNGVPDECEFAAAVSFTSPDLSPIGSGSPQSHTFAAPPEALGDVVMTFACRADVGFPAEYIDVEVNGFPVGTAFNGAVADCPAVEVADDLLVPRDLFNTIVAGGDAFVALLPSADVTTNQCVPPSFIRVGLDYPALDPAHDADGSGVPDACECPADVDGSGAVDVIDLLALLAAWGTDPGGPPDLNGDGTVGVTDLLALLAGWGAC